MSVWQVPGWRCSVCYGLEPLTPVRSLDDSLYELPQCLQLHQGIYLDLLPNLEMTVSGQPGTVYLPSWTARANLLGQLCNIYRRSEVGVGGNAQ